MAIVFSNNARTTLASNISNSATTITVADGSVFPSLTGGDIFYCTIDDGTNNEIVEVTAISSNTLTVVRAQDNTTARAFVSGDLIELRLVAKVLETFPQVETGEVTADEFIGDLRGAVIFKAQAGEAVSKGDAVYVSGISGNTPVVALADADFASKMPAFGLVLTAASLNGSTEVVTFGTISGLDTSAFSVGDTLYVSTTAGELTNSKPTGEASLLQNIGKVQRSHASSGAIKVGGAGRTNDTPNLNDGNIFIGNASNQATTASLNTKIEDYLDANGLTLPDNVKANFGSSNDLQIYHDGHSYIKDAGSGNLVFDTNGNGMFFKHGDETLFEAYADGAVNLRHNNQPKLSTTSSGIDVTGTVTADGLTVDGDAIINDTDAIPLIIQRNGGTDANTSIRYEQDTYNTYVGTGNSGTFVVGNAADLGSSRRFAIEQNNDISFYEDTGTTAKFFWDASAESLGIGTTSPTQSKLVVDGTISIPRSEGFQYLESISGGFRAGIFSTNTNAAGVGFNSLRFFVNADNTDPAMVIGGSTNNKKVGIGTSSPAAKLEVAGGSLDINGTDDLRLRFLNSGSFKAGIQVPTTSGDMISGSAVDDLAIRSQTNMLFATGGNTERMRLDSSGNLLVAQSSTTTPGTGNTTTGISLRDVGAIHASRNGNRSLYVNRNTTDGQIISVQKDGTEVGSIGSGVGDSSASTLYIADAGNVGIRFDQASTDDIQPCTSTGADRDNAINLGASDNRFKDLYLSGTANIDKALIGTSSAGATDAKLTLENGFSDCSIYIGAGGDYNYIRSIRNANNDHDLAIGKNYSGGSDAEHLRITNEGNLLVGKNSDDGTAGVRIGGSGTIVPIASGIPIIADRLSSDGEIIRFRKDGGTVGSIGNNTDFYIASQDGTGLRFTNNQILPCSESGAIQNTSRDLGSSSGKFRDLYLSGTANTGNIVTTGYLRGPSTFTIDPAAHGDDTGTVVIAGNLQVDGTTTTINSTTLTVDDKNITLASGSTNAAAANGAGLTVDCGSDTDATFTYDGTNDEWDFNKNITTTGHYIADTHFRSSDGNATLSATGGGGVYLRPDGNSNSANQVFIASGTGNATFAGTISSGDIDVTGTVTADGLTVDGTATINGTTPLLYLTESDTTDLNSRIRNTAGNFQIHTANDAQNSFTARLNISHSTGDISFYEDTGTTAKFFWDASTERLGLGTDNPSVKLHIEEAITGDASQLRISNGAGATLRMGITGSGANEAAHIKTNSGENLEFHIGQAANATTPTMRISSTVVDVNVFLDLNDNYITGVNSYRNVAGNEIIDSNNTSYTIVKSYAGVNRLWLGETSTYANNNNFFFRDTGSNHLVTINSDGLDIRSGGLDINSLEVIDSSRNLTNIGTISSGAITSTGISNFQRDIRSAGQIRATGWYNATATTDYTGMALEIGVSGTQPHILAYNRDTTSYGAMQIHSAGLTIDPRSNDVTIKGVVNLTSSGHLEINGTTVIDSSRNLTNIGTISSGAINTTGAITIDVDDQADGALRIEANQTNPDNDFYFAQEITSTLSGTTATTGDREQGGIYMDINSTATGGDTSNEHRAYGMHIDLDSTGDADLVYGVYSNATATPTTGSTTNVYGGYFHAEDNGGNGQVSTLIGVQGTSVSDNSTSDVNAMYGGYFKNYNQTDSAAITASTAVYGEIEIPSGTGDIYGTSYIFRAEYDNNSTVAQTNTTYLYYGNYAGVLPTNAYGVYIADAVDNYFAGSISSGAITSTGLTVATASGAVINLQDTGSHNWQLATDNQDNFFKVKDGSSITYLKVGTADSEFATNLNLTSGHSYKINGTTVIDSSRKIFTPEIELGGDAEHKLRYSIGSIISGGTTHTTILQGRQVDIYGYDDIQIRAGSSDKIVLTASGSSKIQLDANTNIVNGILKIGGSTFADQSRNITAGTISSGAITSSGHIQSAGALKVTETGTSQVIMIGNQDSGGVNTPAMIMGVNGVIRIGHGSSWSGEGGTFTEKIAISGSDLKITSGGLILNATTVIDSSRNLSNIGTITTSGAIDLTGGGDTTDAGSVHLPRGSHITFYGNNNADHSIGSRNNVGGVTDDLRISSYGALYIDLDSNDNNGSSADFVIGRHGSGTGTMSNLFSVSGETGAVISNSNITAYGSASDIRLKENIEVIQNPIDKVQRLRGVTFNYKKDGSKSTGLIAQELEEVLPEVVYETHDLHDAEDKFKAVRYGNIIGLLVEAIKDQQKEIEYMKSEIKNLKENNNGN